MRRVGLHVNENKKWGTYPRGENRTNLLLLANMEHRLENNGSNHLKNTKYILKTHKLVPLSTKKAK